MSTNNFHSVNSKGVFAIEDIEDDDDGYLTRDNLDYIKEEVIDELKKVNLATVLEQDETPEDELRSYPARVFGTLEGKANRWDSCARIVLIIRGGYYSGHNLDYTIEYLGENNYAVDAPEDVEKWDGQASNTEVMALRGQARRLEAAVVKAFKNHSTALNKVGQFSNGEAVYEKA